MPLQFRPLAFLERKPSSHGRGVHKQAAAAAAEQIRGDMVVEGEVFEVVQAFSVAHLRAADGQVYGINRKTPGIQSVANIREGQRYRCEVTAKFNRVLRAELIA